jgi:hypothetical protein
MTSELAETREFRGISKRLAAQYLETLGGERVDEAGDRIDGDGWSAELSEQTVNPVGSITLNEVRIHFEGESSTLRPLIDAFAQKAMRAGG